jgi:2-polyprenyl-6-hydroxyphenyl methylase/3-demethylubiquinone-9 3-methyltransferase
MTTPNIDPVEIDKFRKQAAHWWDPQGELKTLHHINPIRLEFIDKNAPLRNKKVLDIGCGGGILSEGMAKLGAHVTGIDMCQEAIQVAQLHQHESGTSVDYFVTTAETLAAEQPAQFDIVTCLELLEHVPDPASIVNAAAQLTKPGGHLFFSTLNRTMKSYLLAIVGAEYVMKLIPKNTHDYAKFIRPSELSEWLRSAGLATQEMTGMSYNPWTKECRLTTDVSVNYLVFCTIQK